MKINYYSSTSEVLLEIGRRVKSSRIDMSITQREMAEITNLSVRTISNFETGKDVSFSTVIEVLRVLGQLQSLDIMIPEQMIRPTQVMALGKERERVSSKRSEKKSTSSDWRWGDEQ